ncbi:IS1634 family transposase [Enterococcus cecorum]|uniref:Transposase n=1 Tax=Enterococcus cecorum TaxID=44008 RepID=A0A200I387_9ENTE|nr:hypothetical protein [Enterococcus cecorum]OUZ19553.1 hypothetical protein A5869_001207 [Enterococcus cecorum]
MAFRLKSTKSKSSESFSIIDDYVNPTTGKRSTYIVEALGSLSSLMEKYQTDNREDVIKQLKIYIQAKKEEHDELNGDVTVTLPQSTLHKKDETVVYNLGYLYIRNILCAVGIKKICNKIQDNYKFKYNLFDILCDLICARIIFPNSKRATFSFKKRFLHHTDYELEDVYRALQILYKERYTLESAIYNESTNIYNRDSSILFYDCTNFYFEIEDADDFRLYGVSKEHRPNPIVQYGLFMDAK